MLDSVVFGIRVTNVNPDIFRPVYTETNPHDVLHGITQCCPFVMSQDILPAWIARLEFVHFRRVVRIPKLWITLR
jgi:hypothetical protein